MDAFFGICGSLFPQYFINAILLGVCHLYVAFSIEKLSAEGMNCAVFKSKIFAVKIKLFTLDLQFINTTILNRKLKLIWDFKGEDGLETAKHHCIHLKEFAITEKLHYYEIHHEQLNEFHSIAFITVDEVDMKTYRDALIPHRGELA